MKNQKTKASCQKKILYYFLWFLNCQFESHIFFNLYHVVVFEVSVGVVASGAEHDPNEDPKCAHHIQHQFAKRGNV